MLERLTAAGGRFRGAGGRFFAAFQAQIRDEEFSDLRELEVD